MNRRYLLFMGVLALAVLALCIVSDQAEARTCTWDGGGANALASTKENWDLDTAPIAGDSILINSGSKAITWDVSAELGTFTIASGYSGVVTQSSDIYIQGFSQGAGTFTGSLSKWMYLSSGVFSQTAGTLTGDNLRLNLINSSLNAIVGVPQNLKMDGVCYINTTGEKFSRMFTNTGTLIILNQWDVGLNTSPYTVSNTGTIAGCLNIWLYSSNVTINAGIGTDTRIYARSSANGNRVVTLSDNAAGITIIQSSHATYTCTLDLNDNNLTSSSITVGIRGILQCGEGTIFTGSLDSSVGTITPETSTWIFTNNALVKMAAGGTLYDVEVNGTTLRLGSDVTMNSLMYISLTTSHPYGLYINGTRDSSVTTDPNGSYSFGSGVFAWDNATLKITPVITIDGWERTDGGLRNVVWEGYDYWADHDADAAVSWTLSGTSWLSTDANGNITGEAGDDGTYYYTLTATAANGEEASVSGFIIVENSINEGLDVAFSWLSPLIGLMAIGFLAVALSALSGSWTKKK